MTTRNKTSFSTRAQTGYTQSKILLQNCDEKTVEQFSDKNELSEI